MRQVAAFGVCLWLATIGCTATLLHLSGHQLPPVDLADFGLVFLGYALVASLVARRCLDVSMVVVALWGAAVGFWGPRWVALSDSVLDRWVAIAPLPEAMQQADLRLAVAVAAAGLLTASLLYIPTRSSRVVFQTAAAGVVAAVLLWLPLTAQWSVGAAVIMWHAIVCAGLCSWMVQGSQRREGGCCPRCGVEVRGLSSPVCPACGAALAAIGETGPAAPVLTQRRPI